MTSPAPKNAWDRADINRRDTITPARVEDDIERLYSMFGILATALMYRAVTDDADRCLKTLMDAGKAIFSNFPEDYKEALKQALT